MRSNPGPDRPFGNVDVQSFADHTLRIAHGVAEVVSRNRVEDHAGRVGLILSCSGSVFMEALSTLEDLEISGAVQSLALFYIEFRAASRTSRVEMCALRGGHREEGYLECSCGLLSRETPDRSRILAGCASHLGGNSSLGNWRRWLVRGKEMKEFCSVVPGCEARRCGKFAAWFRPASGVGRRSEV
jgi:hypothetical protein